MTSSAVLVALTLGAVAPQAAIGPLDVGPAVGDAIPRFEARDQAGRLRSFDDLTGPNGLLLLFFRSADW